MSMSQEEIEALMNGLDISDDNEPEETTSSVNTEEIEELLSKTEEIKDEVNVDDEDDESFEDLTMTDKSIDDLINEVSQSSSNDLVDNDEIDKLLKDIETNDEEPEEKDIEKEIDDIDELLKSTEDKKTKSDVYREESAIVESWTTDKINQGVFPLPAEKDTKVVSQLSQVANDSEEKVGQIFDVLSLSLDNNNALRSEIKNIQKFLEEEKKLLNSLTTKFPNIGVFNKHLAEISNINDKIATLNNITFEEDNKIFEAMELMQFNDINRQKIERVMAVIRKLSLYLNNLFEDDGSSAEVAVAKHIHGDDTNDLIGDDLDKLIAEFSNKE